MRFLIYILILFSTYTFSQSEVSFEQIDSDSYVEFMNNDFKKIKKTGELALKNNFDFYYLRMRLGIVGYNHKNYEYALPHFEMAFSMNPGDTLVQEYLYYSYLFTGRSENAQALANKLTETFQQKVGYKRKKFDSVLVGFGAFTNKNIENNLKKNLLGSSTLRTDAVFYGTVLSENILIQNNLGSRFKLYNKFNVFQTNSLGVEQLNTPSVKAREAREYKNTQLQYNLGLSYQSKKDYFVSGGFAYFQTNISNLESMIIQSTGQIRFDDLDSTFNDILTSFSFGKRFKNFFPVISASYCNLFDVNQFQAEANLTYFPFGNNNFYLGSSVAIINLKKDTNTVFTQKLGLKLTDWLRIEAKYSNGNLLNYMTNNGFIAYNSVNPILQEFGLEFKFLFKKLELNLAYSYQEKRANYQQYTTPLIFETVKYFYYNNNFITTLKWNF